MSETSWGGYEDQANNRSRQAPPGIDDDVVVKVLTWLIFRFTTVTKPTFLWLWGSRWAKHLASRTYVYILLFLSMQGPSDFSLEKKKVNPNLRIVRLCVWAHLLNHVWLFVTPWTVAHRAPLSMEFSGKNTGMGCRFLLQRICPTWRSSPRFLSLPRWQADALFTTVPPGRARCEECRESCGNCACRGRCFDSHRYFA